MTASTANTSASGDASSRPRELRGAKREPLAGDLWLIDSRRLAALRAAAVDCSRTGLRVRLAPGNRLDDRTHVSVCTYRPGQASPPGLPGFINRGATVVWSRSDLPGAEGWVDVGLRFDPPGSDE